MHFTYVAQYEALGFYIQVFESKKYDTQVF